MSNTVPCASLLCSSHVHRGNVISAPVPAQSPPCTGAHCTLPGTKSCPARRPQHQSLCMFTASSYSSRQWFQRLCPSRWCIHVAGRMDHTWGNGLRALKPSMHTLHSSLNLAIPELILTRFSFVICHSFCGKPEPARASRGVVCAFSCAKSSWMLTLYGALFASNAQANLTDTV